MTPRKIVILGLSITSSWGNGHATTYRSLMRALAERGDDVLFLERDLPWYADNRDLPEPPYGRTALYTSLAELRERFAAEICSADLVIVGSYVPEGVALGEWVTRRARGVTAFYDIDTPVTLARLVADDADYISRALIARYRLYLSFSGGPILDVLEQRYHSPMARPLYCSVDPALYFPEPGAAGEEPRWDVGYMGTYSADRQPALERLLLEPARRAQARRFALAGPQYPKDVIWPANVERITHLPPREHRAFYNAQRYTLNVTRAAMMRAGHSPSVRLFEAAACATPILSDDWPGLDGFFEPDREILVVRKAEDTLAALRLIPEHARRRIGQRARARVLAEHTAAQRARELIGYLHEVSSARGATASAGAS